ncbi:MAG TPA: hypothetical protein VM513_27255 [Kofleriaceae bacterium]|nr:hypothetical protein [Kofleriaceae bacterium]
MRTRALAVVAITVGVACGPRVVRAPETVSGDELTLYRDRAVLRKRVEVTIPEADKAIVKFTVPAGVDPEDVVILDHGDLTVTPESVATNPAGPTELRFVVGAPRAGRFSLGLGYATDQITWDAAYTVTTTPARTHATVRGAIAIRNATGVTFRDTRVLVVDGDLGSLRARVAEEQTQQPEAKPAVRESAVVPPRALGALTLGPGETRVELLAGERPRPVHSVLVYDPIGTKLDHGGTSPIRDPKLGMGKASTQVRESLEIMRPAPTSDGLPGGPARMFERRPDGTLALIGESRMFDASTSVAAVDIIELGTAEGVTGQRERGEFALDDDRKRLVEELTLTVANTRAYPIDVVLREHLYRGKNWALAFTTAIAPKKDGAQQISMRLRVPAQGEAKVFYVVVYTWQ